MLLLRTFAPWLLLAFLGQQVYLSSGAAEKLPGRAQRSGAKSAATGQGKFSTKDKTQCTWSAKDVGDNVKLLVKCENPEARATGGTTDLRTCEYTGKPQRCPGYQSDPKGFWKQVARALKRLQSKACRDQSALVRAGMCKRAPRDAHFKLDPTSSRTSSQAEVVRAPPPTQPPRSASSGPTACTRRADHRKTAEEYCSSSWASVCTFFLSMLQSEDC
ncbi:fibroblast growth factor-binding protein 1-like [Parambassis ranga]|uniref:Fibroblast growth factor-binding protein 1 n=1 Tax=Parambassis ranga TaxID=210632 RepID=A0A6P7IHT8_9TELE|nr:fibroblast growth factor-binding protein 1 [Parambassis ranga]XP_028265148.1 fibroblast growth factor-binding protein 1 [Parambassis ranga]